MRENGSGRGGGAAEELVQGAIEMEEAAEQKSRREKSFDRGLILEVKIHSNGRAKVE